jgi:hypothetical protein
MQLGLVPKLYSAKTQTRNVMRCVLREPFLKARLFFGGEKVEVPDAKCITDDTQIKKSKKSNISGSTAGIR